MSFSSSVKEELVSVYPKARHCELAELSALLSALATVTEREQGELSIRVSSDHITLLEKIHQLILKSFGYDSTIHRGNNNKENKKIQHNTAYELVIEDSLIAGKILSATRLMDADGRRNDDFSMLNTTHLNNSCCKRAFLRGAFCAGGSISDPEKSYHLEIVTDGRSKANQIVEAMRVFDLEAHVVVRRKSYVVYLKEGAQIVDMLNVMNAHVSLMELENVRILKEMRNSINRKVNCEAANLGKTIAASVKQAEDIRYIDETIGLHSLKEGLEEIARLRLQYPDIPLKELGLMLSPPVGKSGVNHRLRKISEIADELRVRDNKGGLRQ